jgi:hypothetical protein
MVLFFERAFWSAPIWKRSFYKLSRFTFFAKPCLTMGRALSRVSTGLGKIVPPA